MFLGNYPAITDAKGRINVPSRYRDILEEKYGSNLILSVTEDCLVVYPQSEWAELEGKYRKLSPLRKDVRIFYRLLYSRASECVMKHGRILVPPSLRTQAGLNKEVIIAGVSRMIEIWNKNKWEKFMSDNEGQFEGLGNKLSEV